MDAEVCRGSGARKEARASSCERLREKDREWFEKSVDGEIFGGGDVVVVKRCGENGHGISAVTVSSSLQWVSTKFQYDYGVYD